MAARERCLLTRRMVDTERTGERGGLEASWTDENEDWTLKGGYTLLSGWRAGKLISEKKPGMSTNTRLAEPTTWGH